MPVCGSQAMTDALEQAQKSPRCRGKEAAGVTEVKV